MIFRTYARPLALAAACLLTAAFAVDADARDRKDCERDYKPQVGQSGKDVVWVPTPDELVQRMLRMAKVTPQDLVYDLGAGDGKIAIAAGKLGANSVGIEYNPDMAKLANCMVTADGVASKTKIIQGDIFKEDFSKATVITMYLLPELNLCVRHRILAHEARHARHLAPVHDGRLGGRRDVGVRVPHRLPVDRAGARGRNLGAARRQRREHRGESDADVPETHRRRRERRDPSSRSWARRCAAISCASHSTTTRASRAPSPARFEATNWSARSRVAASRRRSPARRRARCVPPPWAEMLAQCGRFYGK